MNIGSTISDVAREWYVKSSWSPEEPRARATGSSWSGSITWPANQTKFTDSKNTQTSAIWCTTNIGPAGRLRVFN